MIREIRKSGILILSRSELIQESIAILLLTHHYSIGVLRTSLRSLRQHYLDQVQRVDSLTLSSQPG